MAPNKKYLSLEEAAAQLGVKVDELIRLREKGDVRGFADRGTWKFKADDVAEYRRRQQPDSDPDLPIMDDADDDDELGRQATVIRHGAGAKSDSDVRLYESNPPTKQDSDSDVKLVKPKSPAESDSDVKIIGTQLPEEDSDSDVKLIDPRKSLTDSDSDVRLATSDSDVRLAPLLSSDSDVKLVGGKDKGGLAAGSDSDVMLLPRSAKGESTKAPAGKKSDSGPLLGKAGNVDFDPAQGDDESVLEGDDSDITLGGGSGIRLSDDSGIQLAGDSGIQLAGDSGIRLAGISGIRMGGDSGIRLADDSGVELKHAADSGISLEGMDSGIQLAEESGLLLGEDSGINLAGPSSSNLLKGSSGDLLKGNSHLLKSSSKNLKGGKPGSSKKLKGTPKADVDDLDSTAPMTLAGLGDDELDKTAPLLSATDASDPSGDELDDFSDTTELGSGHNVVMFEEDEDEAPAVQKKRRQPTIEESIFEVDETGEEELEELEVSDDDLSGESDFDESAFEESEDELDESFTTGSSRVGFGAGQKVAIAQEVEWSAGFCTLLMGSLLLLFAGTLTSVELLRTTWASPNGSSVDKGVVSYMEGLWK
jgi:excisionase family DNA binding protein